MNNQQAQTAGKTAIDQYRTAIFDERKAKAQDIIANTYCALIFYMDKEMRLRTYALSEEGYETAQLQMLSSAASIARDAVENVFNP